MEKQPVIVGLRRMYDEEAEGSFFLIEVYDLDANGKPRAIIDQFEKHFHDDVIQFVEFQLTKTYNVQATHYLFKEDKITSVPAPLTFTSTHYHYRMSLDEFQQKFQQWLRYEKGWDVAYEFHTDSPDDVGYLGSLYLEIEHEEIDQDTLDEMYEWIGDIEHLTNYIREMFDSRYATYDYNYGEDEIYIFVPTNEYIKENRAELEKNR